MGEKLTCNPHCRYQQLHYGYPQCELWISVYDAFTQQRPHLYIEALRISTIWIASIRNILFWISINHTVDNHHANCGYPRYNYGYPRNPWWDIHNASIVDIPPRVPLGVRSRNFHSYADGSLRVMKTKLNYLAFNNRSPLVAVDASDTRQALSALSKHFCDLSRDRREFPVSVQQKVS